MNTTHVRTDYAPLEQKRSTNTERVQKLRRASHIKGFTFIEMIVVLALFAILSLAIADAILMFYRANAYTLEQAYEVNSARRGLELFTRDIREMTFGDDGTYPLATMGTNTIAFYSDIDRDSSVEYVRYTLSGTTLYKYIYNATGTPIVYATTTPSETHVVSEYVRNNTQATSTFRYYIEGGSIATATSTVTDVRYVLGTLIINVDPNRSPGEFSLRATAAPRNLKTSF
jgi:prepilin-type N-terminal cleavage/methylation domain-containing protein